MQSRTSRARPAHGDADLRSILDSLRRIVRDLRRDGAAASSRLTAAQLFVLHALDGAGAVSMNELAARTYTHQSSVSVVAKGLAARGLVARGSAASDRRRAEVSLTPKGRAALRRAPRAPQDRLVAGIAAVSAASRAELARSLSDLVRAMSLGGEEATMFFDEPRRRRRARS
jgi:MarR family transcriptional regulator, lower aerobic nicotinate degradation pathway regulator